MQNMKFPWSDNWWIEGDKAWFCAGEINALFCVDMNSRQCDLVARIPERDFRNFRLYSYCVKYGDIIFCLPTLADCIWCYDLKKKNWTKIDVGNKNQFVISTTAYNQKRDCVWLSEDKADRIFEINLEKKVLEKKYNITSNGSEVFDGCILVENKLYCIADNRVFCISIDCVDISTYNVFGAKARLATICYDGCDFWISGFCKEIYIWNPEQGIVKTLTEFPEQFGIYNFNEKGHDLVDYDSFFSRKLPFFIMSISLKKYVWYIPLQSNQIIYIDKETYKIDVLEIEEEQETEESLQRAFDCKYLVQYIREERYIGLYSFKNQLIFEIDTVNLCVKNPNYKLSDNAFLAIVKADGYYDGRRMLREGRKNDQLFFSALLNVNDKKSNYEQNVGELIYHTLNRS